MLFHYTQNRRIDIQESQKVEVCLIDEQYSEDDQMQ